MMHSQVTNYHNDSEETMGPQESLFLPFQNLSRSDRRGSTREPINTLSLNLRQSSHSRKVSTSTTARSAPISLPETHIHRTPSELQFAADTINAECKDIAMYSRLMVGMHKQIQHRNLRSGTEDVHPLSWKSMVGIARTKQASECDLERQDVDDGWDLSHSLIDEDYSSEHSSIASSLPPSREASIDCLTALLSGTENGDQEDDCLFDLEM
mmetsp:Transcript_36006/g.61422  ORF Transcript_36006/g.61422 Transcript_36006/m.61422 type:complete len:211 (+) Transcript_36006:139-771(+)